jgi:hypothetical protein
MSSKFDDLESDVAQLPNGFASAVKDTTKLGTRKFAGRHSYKDISIASKSSDLKGMGDVLSKVKKENVEVQSGAVRKFKLTKQLSDRFEKVKLQEEVLQKVRNEQGDEVADRLKADLDKKEKREAASKKRRQPAAKSYLKNRNPPRATSDELGMLKCIDDAIVNDPTEEAMHLSALKKSQLDALGKEFALFQNKQEEEQAQLDALEKEFALAKKKQAEEQAQLDALEKERQEQVAKADYSLNILKKKLAKVEKLLKAALKKNGPRHKDCVKLNKKFAEYVAALEEAGSAGFIVAEKIKARKMKSEQEQQTKDAEEQEKQRKLVKDATARKVEEEMQAAKEQKAQEAVREQTQKEEEAAAKKIAEEEEESAALKKRPTSVIRTTQPDRFLSAITLPDGLSSSDSDDSDSDDDTSVSVSSEDTPPVKEHPNYFGCEEEVVKEEEEEEESMPVKSISLAARISDNADAIQAKIAQTAHMLSTCQIDGVTELDALKKAISKEKDVLRRQIHSKIRATRPGNEKQAKKDKKAIDQDKKVIDKLKEDNKRLRHTREKELPKHMAELTEKNRTLGVANEEVSSHLQKLNQIVKKLQGDHDKLRGSNDLCRDEYLPRYRHELYERKQYAYVETKIKELYRNVIRKIAKALDKSKQPNFALEIKELIAETEIAVNPTYDPKLIFGGDCSDDSDSSSSIGSDSY